MTLGRLPGPVWTMLVWSGIDMASVAIIGTFLAPAGAPAMWWIAALAGEGVVVGVLVAWGPRTPTWFLRVVLFGKMIALLGSCLLAVDAIGVLTSALGLTVAVVYAAYWWPSLYAYASFAVAAVGFLLVVRVTGDVAELGMAWFFLTTIWFAIAAGLSHVARQMERRLTHDPLTGLVNRTGLEDYLELFPRAGRAMTPRSLVVIDLDDFKGVNDTRGHLAGDQLLKDSALTWRKVLRPDDLAVRSGGDEFLLILPQTDEAGARALIDRLREMSPAPWSAGIAEWSPDESFDSACQRADARMYEEKKSSGQGRGREPVVGPENAR